MIISPTWPGAAGVFTPPLALSLHYFHQPHFNFRVTISPNPSFAPLSHSVLSGYHLELVNNDDQ